MTVSPACTGTRSTTPSMPAKTSRRSTGSRVPLHCTLKSQGQKHSAASRASTAAVMVSVLGRVRAPTIQRPLPSARQTGMRKRFWCSRALAIARELCRQTTSTRCAMAGAGRLSSICSTISAPTTGGGSVRFSASSSSSGGGRRKGSTATVFECDSSTYSWTASSTCGAMSAVSPVYQMASPLRTTAEASRPSRRMVLERLSKTSWPLTASITHLLPLRTATLTRSHSINRRPSLAIV